MNAELNPGARTHDPATSHAAAEMARSMSARHREMILAALMQGGPGTIDEISTRIGLDSVQIARRLSELERADAAEVTGRTRPSIFGRPQREWRAKERSGIRLG